MTSPTRVAEIFGGLGGWRAACDQVEGGRVQCVFSAEPDPVAQLAARLNHRYHPRPPPKDPRDVPDHDLLCATIGRLIGDNGAPTDSLARLTQILGAKTPAAFAIDTSKQLLWTRDGDDMFAALQALDAAGYHTHFEALCLASHGGLPQKTERLFLVGFRSAEDARALRWPAPREDPPPTLAEVLGVPVVAALARTAKKSSWTNAAGERVRSDHYERADGEPPYALTVPDALALAGLPRDFQWPPSAEKKRFELVGSVTPVPLAKAVVEAVDAARSRTQPRAGDKRPRE